MHPVGCHPVGRSHGAQSNHVFVGTLITHHANRLNRQKHCPGLPYLVVQSPLFQSVDKNSINFLKNRHFFGSYVAQNADSQSRSRKGMTAKQFRINTQSLPYPANFVFESRFSGSTTFRCIFSGNPPTLWCDFMVAEGPFTETDSITSG